MKKKLLLTLIVCSHFIFAQPSKGTVSNLLRPVIHWNAQSVAKDQGVYYNTCTAFAIAAALETFPNVPKDLSEKYLYAMQKAQQYANNNKVMEGHFLKLYPKSLQIDGVIEEKYLPYKLTRTPNAKIPNDNFERVFFEGGEGFMTLMTKYKPKARVFLREYEYLEGHQAKNVAYIKQLLRNGIKAIPVSYPILYRPAWRKYKTNQFNTISIDDGFKVKTGPYTYNKYSLVKPFYKDLNQKIFTSVMPLENSAPIQNYSGGHAVTIIGYDSQGFIIKNSYGTDWRFNGYERISFDFHAVFAIEALVIKSVYVKKKSFLGKLFD